MVAIGVGMLARAHAETITGEVGPGYLAYVMGNDTPAHRGPAVSIALSWGGELAPDVQLAVRGHVLIGDGAISTVGSAMRHRVGRWIVGYGLALARVRGPVLPYTHVESLGFGAEVRGGVRLGAATITAHVLPIWVVRDPGPGGSTPVRAVLEFGVAAGIEL